jgi:uncharacterized Zn finger protein
MSWQDWGERGGRPIPVEGGLVARSERGAIGATWWSRRFLAVLEALELGGRLTRGRAYARKGQVVSLDVAPGVVSATVQGSRPRPYQVSVGLAVLPGPAWRAVEEALGAQALHRAQLLAGELPADLEEVFTGAGTSLFPTSARDLVMRCTCPDPSIPCKHVAAALYLLAERFDDDPFALLLWRGRARDELLADLGATAGPADGARGADEDQPDAAAPGSATAVLADLPALDVATALDRFWLPPVPLGTPPPTLDAGPDLVLRSLPAPPQGLGGRRLTETLRELYLRLPDGEPGDTDPEATDPAS